MKAAIHLLVTFDLPKPAREQIKNLSERIHLKVIPTDDASHIPTETWEETDILFTDSVLPEPEKSPNLKWVQFNSAGLDPFQNHDLISSREITVTTMSGAITGQIGEYVLMAMLALGHRLPLLRRHQQDKHWAETGTELDALVPSELRHSRVGIIGYGSIGRQVARLLRPFGAKVLAVKKDVMHPEDSGYTPEGMGDPEGDFFHRLYPLAAVDSVIAESDFVVLALPLTDDTHYLMNAERLAHMKKTAFLINVGRGALIDQQALIDALRVGQIAGAALDVFEHEPLPDDSPLWEMDQVIVTPHVSGLSRYLSAETLALFTENLTRFINGKPLFNEVDPSLGY